MKLRIKGDSLRLRLEEGEVEELCCRGRVQESIHFGSGRELAYGLETDPGLTRFEVVYEAARVVVRLPEAAAREWATSEQVGLEERLEVGGERRLRVLVEKDFPCAHRTP